MKYTKFLLPILVLFLLLNLGIPAKAVSYAEGKCGDNVFWTLDDGTLTITGSGPMSDFSAASPGPWHNLYNSIKTVKIAEGVTTIGSYAFYNLDPYYPYAITSVTIPKSLVSVGTMAFSDCSQLTDVYYAGTCDTWTELTIGTYNETLQSVTIHGSDRTVSMCGQSTFWELDNQGTLIISGHGATADWNGYTVAPWHHLRYDINKIIVRQGVTYVGRYAFKWSSAKEAILADSVVSIGNYAFENSDLERITVGTALNRIGEGAFDKCNRLKTVALPDTVTTIGKFAFRDCTALQTVALGTGLTTLGESAFSGCSALKEITLPNGITAISDCTFLDCKAMTRINFPKNLKAVGGAAFRNCNSLTHILLPDSVTELSSEAFRNCSSLTSIYIPVSVTKFGWKTFANTSLKQLYYAGTKSQWQNMIIDEGNECLSKATIYYESEGNHIACNHSYGSWKNVDNTNHGKTCSICQNLQIEAHTWDNGTVIKQANCKESGQVKFACTTCSAVKTENTNKTEQHTYGSWTKANDMQHKQTCSVCFKEETANHTWNSGTVTQKATCKEDGAKTYTCTTCNATKTEAIAKLTTHTYDHACDTDCNVCGVTRTTTHNYKTSWSKDKTNHWHECSVCKDKKDVAAHTPGAEATETKAQTCTTCGYVIKAALGHTHKYASTWTTDENGHWYACSGCEEKGSYAAHDFENACDKDCSICGYTRETEHKFAETWNTDANNHWHECTSCGLKQDEAAHEPGAEATATTAQTCTICGYEIAPALGGEEAKDPTESTPATNPATDPTIPTDKTDPEDGNFPWWIIIVAVVAAGGVVAVVVIKKKK